MKKNLFVIAVIFLNLSFSVFAQTGIEETPEYLTSFALASVYTPAHMKQSAMEAPAIIKVITEDQILSRGYRTVMDVLCDTVGISSDISNEFMPLIKLRGSSTTGAGILFLLNGQKLNSTFYDGILEFIHMQTDQIRQIEIIRGPGGAVWGAGAFEGVVNIITRQNCEENSVSVSGAFGSDQYKTGDLLINCQKDTFFLDINYDYYESNQLQLKVQKDFGDFLMSSPLKDFFNPEMERLTPGVFEQEAVHKIWNGGVGKENFKMLYYYSDYVINAFGGNYFLVGNDYAEGSLDYCLKPEYSFEINESTECEVSYTHQRMKTGSRRNGLAVTPKRYGLNADLNADGDFEYWPGGALLQYEIGIRLSDFECILSSSWEEHLLKLGLLYEKMEVETEKDSRNFYFSGPESILSLAGMRDFSSSSPMVPEVNRETKALYLQDVFSLSREVSLVGGARYEKLSDLGEQWSSRAGFIRSFDSKVFKFLYGEAFRAPSIFELYSFYDSGEDWSMGNPDLKAERISTLESSLGFKCSERTEMNLNVYYTLVRNKIFRIAHRESPRGYYNRDLYRIKGFETEILQRYERISFFLQYAYTLADRDFVEAISAIYPLKHSAGAGFDATPFENTTFYFGYYYEGDTERYSQEGDLRSAHYVNTALTRKIFENTRLSFSVYNLFDEKNYYSGVKGKTSDIERPGRSMTLKLQYSF